MKFLLSSLVPLAVLFTSALALPTGTGLCGRALSISFGRLTNGVISQRATVEDHLGKRQVCEDATLQAEDDVGALKRGSTSLDESIQAMEDIIAAKRGSANVDAILQAELGPTAAKRGPTSIDASIQAMEDIIAAKRGSANVDAILQAELGPTAAKRGSTGVGLTFTGQIGGFKRNIDELSKRSEEYNVLVHSLPSPDALFGRSTDPYDGRPVLVNIPENMMQDLQQMGMTQDQLPEYMSQNMHVVDPDTGEVYTLAPGISVTAVVDIVINLIYLPE